VTRWVKRYTFNEISERMVNETTINRDSAASMYRPRVQVLKTGLQPYGKMWDLQKKLARKVLEKKSTHYLLVTEHPAVITMGKSGDGQHLLASPDYLRERNVDFYEIDRGGDVTFHGPGQIVVYPILNLNDFNRDIHWYLRLLEEVVIRVLDHLGIPGERVPGMTGVWSGDKKVCAIGVKVSRWVTMHGFALNVNTDLDFFKFIVPCGITDRGVTSISELSGNHITMNAVYTLILAEFTQVFGVDLVNYDQSLSPEIPRYQERVK
jgi:lipoyl(octanoyl) transferase